jgi:putative ABC transport system permease protein
VIGVVRDYHHSGLQQSIEPIIFYPQNNSAYFTLRLAGSDLPGHVEKIGQIYRDHFPGNPYDYFFADDDFNRQYISERRYGALFSMASVWAVVIACLGLFGLATYTVEARVKEIGIRKVLGAGVAGIALLLSKDFLKLVLIALVAASPLAYYFMEKWLADFAYRIDIEWWMFAGAGAVAVAVAVLTVGFQSVKAALANPVQSLRNE